MGMTPPSPTSATMTAVTISRQYGSGGGEVAARLARRLGWSLIDYQIVARVASEAGISEQVAAARDEDASGRLGRVIESLFSQAPEGPVTPDNLPTNPAERYHRVVCRVLDEIVAGGRVVIVGRGAQAEFHERRDMLHVRVVAPLEQRIAYVVQREGLTPANAKARIQNKERSRAHYLEAFYHRRPDDPLLYDLMVNTAVLSLDSTVDLILRALEHKGRQLNVPEADLGPGAGLGRYPARPQDILPVDRPE